MPLPTTGLILQLDASNASSITGGTTWNDISGSTTTYNGTLNNGASYNGVNLSIMFDGADDWVATSLGSEVNYLFAEAANAFTVLTIFRHDGTAGVINGASAGIGVQTTFAQYTNGTSVYARFRGTTDGNYIGDLAANTWGLLASTWDGTTAKGYLNDNAPVTNSVGGAANQQVDFGIADPYEGILGNYPRLGGEVGVVLVYNRALNDSEILDVYNFYDGIYYTSPVPPIEGDANLSSQITLTAEINKTSEQPYIENGYIESGYFEGVVIEADANLGITASTAATTTRIKQLEADLGTAFTPTMVASVTRVGDTDLITAFAFEANVSRTRTADITLDTIVNLSLQGDRTRDNAVDASAAFATTASVLRLKPLDAALAVSCDTSATATKIKPLSADLGSLFDPNFIAVVGRNGSIDIGANFSVLAVSGNLVQIDETLLSAFTMPDVLAGRLEIASSNYPSTFTQTANVLSYQLRTIDDPWRPQHLQTGYFRESSSAFFWSPVGTEPNWNTSIKKFGTASLELSRETGKQGEYVRIATDWEEAVFKGNTSSTFYKIDADEDFLVEFWVYLKGWDYNDVGLSKHPVFCVIGAPLTDNDRYDTTVSSALIRVGQDNNGYIAGAIYDDTTQSVVKVNSTVRILQDTWTHIRMTRVNGTLYLYRDNFLIGSKTGAAIQLTRIYDSHAHLQHNALIVGATDDKILYDSWTFRQGTWTPGTLSISQPAQNDAGSTIFLHQFDQSIYDDVSLPRITFSGGANLQSTATQTAQGGGAFEGSSTQVAQAFVGVDVDKIVSTGSNQTAQATQTVDATRIRSADLSVSSVTSISVVTSDSKTAGANSSLGVVVTQTATPTRIKQLSSDLFAFNTQIAVAFKVADFFVNNDLVATLTADPQITAIGESTQNALSTFTLEPSVFRDFDSSLSSAFNSTTDPVKTARTTTQADSTATLDAITDRIRPGSSSQTVTADFAAIVEKGTELVQQTLAAQFAASALAEATKEFASSLSSAFTDSFSGIKAVEAELDTAAQAALTAQGRADFVGSADFDSIVSNITVATRIAGLILEPDTRFTLSANVNVIPEGSADLAAQFVQTATEERIRQTDTTQNSNFAFSADVGAIRPSGSIESSEFTITTNAVKQIGATGVLNSNANLDALGTLNAVGSTNTTTTAQLTASSSITRNAVIDLITLFEPSINAGITRVGSIEINSTFNITITGRVVAVDRVVYTIPSEIRSFTIDRETRTHTIHNETRAYTIQGEE